MSTVVFGRCRLANDTPAFIEDKVRQLALKYYPSAEEVEEEIAKDIKGVQSTRFRLSIFAASRFKKNKPPQQVCAQWLQMPYHTGPSSRLGRRLRMQCALTVH